ncbi:Protein CBG08025 [Caenorhabditis briggsae]|uniref:Protein CBG08025 n=1 Tax=Caenorhabditis briggsae TaxID=6238 RepID=A8X5L9_CAEBR|nr:Protein CBG08025 [Caenorhabditis briggsae]CAP27930.2 Protein CBG08025 [Caenorhabditis briggsae]
MSSLDAIVKNAEDIAFQEGEEIIEEVIDGGEVWMGEIGAEDSAYYQAHDLMEHQIVEYDDPDAYQSFLPVRGGDPFYSMNLPDLMSRIHDITQEDGSVVRLVSCFNRKCQRQVAFKGFLYTIKDWVSETEWNTWKCINDQCFGELRTVPDFSNIEIAREHVESCPSDETQIVIRLGVYDARLLAEFTETSLPELYENVKEKVKGDFPEIDKELFPSFLAINDTLKDHRHNRIYRKRFEMQKFKDKQRKLNMTADEVLYAENGCGLIKARRTKPFPLIVSKQETARITIDYCLEHQPHPYDPRYQPRGARPPPTSSMFHQREYIDYYTPEVFMRDQEDRRIRSQKIQGEHVSIVSSEKRPIEVKTYCPPGRIRASFGTRALAPPLAAQLAAGTTQPFVNAYDDVESSSPKRQAPPRNVLYNRQSIRNYKDEQPPAPEPRVQEEDPNLPPPRIYLTQKPYTRMTERQNFKDIYTFNAICKVEDSCLSLLNRLQSCQHARVGLGYKEKIQAILRNTNSDPGLIDGSTEEEMRESWVLQKPTRGRPRKRQKMEEEGEEDGEDDDVEIEERIREEEQEIVVEEKEIHEDTRVVQQDELKDIPLLPEHSQTTQPSTSAASEDVIPQVQRSETLESTSSTASHVASDGTTRSGRARKTPSRLLEQ